jgi:ribonuclease P protein component
MLPTQHRLRKRPDFEDVKKRGRVVPSRLFSFVFVKRADGGVSRFGFVVSTKISKKAVVRNRVRRLLRESVHGLVKELKPGYDCVFLVRNGIVGERFVEVSKEVELVLRKSGLLHE